LKESKVTKRKSGVPIFPKKLLKNVGKRFPKRKPKRKTKRLEPKCLKRRGKNSGFRFENCSEDEKKEKKFSHQNGFDPTKVNINIDKIESSGLGQLMTYVMNQSI